MNRSFPLSPPPNHTPLYLLPLAHGPTMSYIGWVQADGAWALHVLPFQILSKSLPAAHVSAATWRFSVCVPWPFMRAFFCSFALIKSWASYDNGLYIYLAHFWFSLLPATLICYSCRNDLILLDLFLDWPFIPFLSGLSQALFCFYSWAPMSLWASTVRLLILLCFLSLFANSTLPWVLLLTSLGFPGPITLSLSLGFMILP